MKWSIVLRPGANADLRAARNWYSRQQPGLGGEFLDAVEEALDQLVGLPESHAKIFRDVRHFRVRRFPYVIYYRTIRERIEVLAVLHGRRDPKVWQQRT